VSSWLRSLLRRGERPVTGPVVELLVLEGLDAGQRFTVDGAEVVVGRSLPGGRHARGVLLRDPTVSSQQAVIRRQDARAVIEHQSGATNPTLVNGRSVDSQPLSAGDRIQIGRVVMEVSAHAGVSLSDLTRLVDGENASRRRNVGTRTTEEFVIPELADAGDTAIRPVVFQVGQLVVRQGLDLCGQRSFPIWSTGSVLGRGGDCHVRIADLGISRRHAELLCEDQGVFVVHRSQTNPTFINGVRVTDRAQLASGDELQLADRVSFRVEIRQDVHPKPEQLVTQPGRRSLKQVMEEKIALDNRIREQYAVEGSFLDVDVVNSYGMKAETTRAEHVIVSFERFRAYVGDVVIEFGGHVLNSNGDELMCFFRSPRDAVRAGGQILSRLARFNADRNLLAVPFRFRIGIHTGSSLVDFDQGVAYSAVLDTAGHLQKQADENGLVVSEATLRALPEGLPFEKAGTLQRESVDYYRLTAPIDWEIGGEEH
jgi:pSer/pThr/pTyr-binding forkhead associated (FHA) protein